MAKTSFDRRLAEPPSIALVRRLLVAFVAVHVPLALWSGYRAIVQVQHLELRAPAGAASEGARVGLDVVSSGRASVDVWLELVQGARVETLGTRHVPSSGNPAYDPRFRRGSLSVALTRELLSRFRPGPALLRATARGRPQWLREPPPEVRELPVEIRRDPRRPDDVGS